MKLRLSPDLALPPDAVTETFGILAVRGAGKSNTAAVMAEEMFAAKLPFVAVDPVRAWWGLRSSKDGKGPGLAIPIFGGRRGDVPLERGGGQLIADLIVDQRLSCVLDISDFPSADAKKDFLLDFAVRLYQRNEAPLHLFLEEADDYIPQKPMREEARLLRAWENIVRRGRNRGLGCTLITQRSAVVNKNVLEQVQTLIAMRTTGPRDIASIADWLKYHHQDQEILASLAGLEDGEAWVWSPHFLRKTIRVRFRQRETFDSGATPKVTAAAARTPATLADVDLGEIQKRMAATIEKAKAEDPRELRRRIAGLEAELAQAKAATLAPKEKRIEVEVVKPATVREVQLAIAALESLNKLATGVLEKAEPIVARFVEARADLEKSVQELAGALKLRLEPPAPASARIAMQQARPAGRVSAVMVSRQTEPGEALSGPERKLLTALAQHGPRPVTALALLTGYAASGGAFRNPLGKLRSRGYVAPGEPVGITDAGSAALGTWEPLPTGEALLAYWLDRLPGPDAKLLRAVADAYPKAIEVTALAEATGYEATGGAFRNPLGRLRTLRLVEGRGSVRAAEELFG